MRSSAFTLNEKGGPEYGDLDGSKRAAAIQANARSYIEGSIINSRRFMMPPIQTAYRPPIVTNTVWPVTTMGEPILKPGYMYPDGSQIYPHAPTTTANATAVPVNRMAYAPPEQDYVSYTAYNDFFRNACGIPTPGPIEDLDEALESVPGMKTGPSVEELGMQTTTRDVELQRQKDEAKSRAVLVRREVSYKDPKSRKTYKFSVDPDAIDASKIYLHSGESRILIPNPPLELIALFYAGKFRPKTAQPTNNNATTGDNAAADGNRNNTNTGNDSNELLQV